MIKRTIAILAFLLVSLVYAAAQTVNMPMGVQNMTGMWNDDNTATIQLDAPTQGFTASYEIVDLTSITKIVLTRSLPHQEAHEVHVFANPAPGEHLSFTDNTVEEDVMYVYTAIVYAGNGCDYGTSVSVTSLKYPEQIEGLMAETDHGNAPVTLTFKAPSLATDGRVLDKLSKITIKRTGSDWNEVTVKILHNVEPGAQCTVVDDKVQKGDDAYYVVTPFTEDGSGMSSNIRILVDVDVPTEVSLLTAVDTEEGAFLSWMPSVKGVNNGYVDPDTQTYNIIRTRKDEAETVLVEGLSSTTFTDASVFDVPDQHNYTYQVYAVSEKGISDAALVSVVAGKPASVPYHDGFDKPFYSGSTYDYDSWTTYQWVANPTAYDMNSGSTITPRKGLGLVYVSYNANSTLCWEDSFTSGKFDLSVVEYPALSFSYYAIKGDYDNVLRVEASVDGAEFVPIATYDYSNAQQNGWVDVKVGLSKYNTGKWMKIRLVSVKGVHSTLLAVDEFDIINDKESNQGGEDGIGVVDADRTASVAYGIDGVRSAYNGGIMIIDGKKYIRRK